MYFFLFSAASALAGTATKQATGTDLTGTVAGVWSGGSGANGAPTSSDTAAWTAGSLGPGLTLGSAATWGGISVSGATADIGITGAGKLTVGPINLTNVNLTIGNPIGLTGSPTWNVGTAGKTLTATGIISGTGQLTLTGSGTILLSGANSYNGGTVVSGGTAIFQNNTSGSANFTLNNGAILEFTNTTASRQLQGGKIIGTGTLLKGGSSVLSGNSTLLLGGNGQPQTIALTNGLIDVEQGLLRNEFSNAGWGANRSPMNVAAGAVFDVWDGAAVIDALTGAGTINKGYSANCTIVIGIAGGSGVFTGQILNNSTSLGYGGATGGNLSIVKSGSGTQTFSGVNTWAGWTTISNGTLVVGGNGVLGSGTYAGAITNFGTLNYGSSASQVLSGVISGTGSLIVSGSGLLSLTGANTSSGYTLITGGTLGGNGFIRGPLTNAVGGTLMPGLGLGYLSTLIVSNNVVLAGNTLFTLNRTNAQTANQLAASGAIAFGGTLTVANGGDPLQVGDSFVLFSAPSFSGSFSVTNLPSLTSGLFWTNTVAMDGSISVYSTLPPTTAVVTNVAVVPTQIFATSATLNGRVLSTGGQTPTVWIAYGTNDGGVNPAAWSNTVAVGTSKGTFSAVAAGLATNTTYYFTAFASNSAGISAASPSYSFKTLAANRTATHAPVLTYHNDNTRQGLNTNETLLTPATVNTNTFGKLFSYAVDGYVFAQPLVLPDVTIPGQGVHNLVFVATEHDTVYAFDADSNAGGNGGLIWSTSLGNSATNNISPYGRRFGTYSNIPNEVGATGTPVIDPVAGILYVNGFTRDIIGGVTNYVHRLHALDVATGQEKSFSPIVVAGSVPGNGRDSVGGVVTFNPLTENQRPALTLAAGTLYVAYTSYADTDPYHGWIFAYDAATLTLKPNGIFCTTPNASTSDFGANAAEGGIWQSGAGLCVDANLNLYFETGNGSFSAHTNGGDYSDSFIRMSTSGGLTVTDYFTPFDQATRAANDTDLGSGGPILLPDSVGNGTHQHLLVGLDKGGKLFMLDRDTLATPHYQTTDDSQVVQNFSTGGNGFFSSPAYFNGNIYVQAQSSGMQQYAIANAHINTSPVAVATGFGGSVGGPVISANGTNDAIVWGINSSAQATLYAFSATNISQMLYNSGQLGTAPGSRDYPGNGVKFTSPTVTGGKVYVPAQFTLTVFGVQTFLDAPIISPNGGGFVNSVQVSMSDASPGVAIYYTLDGTTPTTGSTLYTAPFTLTSNVVVRAIATAANSVNSAVVSASFVNTAAAGTGTGLRAEYFANATSGNPFSGSPVWVTTNSTINFSSVSNWPGALVGTTNFAVRWTGSVQPQFNETFNFITTADDGVRLYLNGQLLINDWSDKTSATSTTNSISLAAQQLYTIELDYYQKTNNASVTLAWSSPSLSYGVIPQPQLYPFTNPPPSVVLTAPGDGASYTATASVTLSADADAPNNAVSAVSFYGNNVFLGSVSNPPYTLTATGFGQGSYSLSAVATDGSGLSSTSVVAHISVSAGSGQPYGIASSPVIPPYLNMPANSSGSMPPQLSMTGVFSDTPNMTPAGGLILYTPNTPLWSDGALKTRYLAVPHSGGAITANNQISYAPNGSWTFPAGTVFVKTFELNTDTSNPNVLRRLETRLLVRDNNGQVYGVTYKWRPDNSDADLLANSLTEDIAITNSSLTTTQTWYYPSRADCLTCHTPVANYVLGLNTRQLNRTQLYPATGVTDNQLRALNHVGLLNPAIDEGSVASLSKLSSLTNLTASLQDRSRSYFDANCAQCHQPGGTGPTFDARYDTPLANQNLINGGLDANGFAMIVPHDFWRSEIPPRMNSTTVGVRMPPLARNLVDTNAVQVITDWINSLPGSPEHFMSIGLGSNRQFQMNYLGIPGSNYVLQVTTNLTTWVPISTNTATANPFLLFDVNAANYPYRFYRVVPQ